MQTVLYSSKSKMTDFLIHSLFGTKSKDEFVEIDENAAFLTAESVHFFFSSRKKQKQKKISETRRLRTLIRTIKSCIGKSQPTRVIVLRTRKKSVNYNLK